MNLQNKEKRIKGVVYQKEKGVRGIG